MTLTHPPTTMVDSKDVTDLSGSVHPGISNAWWLVRFGSAGVSPPCGRPVLKAKPLSVPQPHNPAALQAAFAAGRAFYR